MRQHSTQGIAIISALLMMVMVLGIAIGSVFLIQNNLRIAENSRSQTVAFYAAESAIELARGQLQAYLDAGNMTLPPSLTLQPVQSAAGVNYNFSLDSYATRNGGTEAVLNVLGFGPNDGEHASVVVLSSGAASSDPPDPRNLYGAGFVGEGTVNLNGGFRGFIDAQVHGNTGFDLSGIKENQFFDCLSRASSGECTDSGKTIRLSENNGANLVTAAESMGSYSCKATGLASACSGNGNRATPAMTNRVAPVSIDTDILGVRNRNSSVHDENGNSVLYDVNGNKTTSSSVCDQTIAAGANFDSSQINNGSTVLCSTGDITLSGTFEGVEIYTTGNVSSGSATITNTTIVADGNLDLGSARVSNSFLYGNTITDIGNSVEIDDSDSGARIGTTIATPGSLTFGGKAIDNTEPLVVSLAVYSGGDITFKGSSNTYATFFTDGDFRFNGNATLYGSIYSKGSIRVNGSSMIDAGISIRNEDAGGGNNNQRRIVDAISRR